MATTTETFQAGDVVQLKSGGPLMTVYNADDYNDQPRAQCYYFDSSNQLQERNIWTVALLKTTNPTARPIMA